MKYFEIPVIEVITFAVEDIITASGDPVPGEDGLPIN